MVVHRLPSRRRGGRVRLWVVAAAVLVVAIAVAAGVVWVTQRGEATSCSVEDAAGCSARAGRTLTIAEPVEGHGGRAAYVTCDGSLLSLRHEDAVITGSGWPVKVQIAVPAGRVLSGDAFAVSPGCEGDGDPNTIDLVLELDGDGRTRGFSGDALKIRSTVDPPGGIQLTGRLDCGPAPEGVHQDGIQLQGGTGIGFYDVEIGDWDAGRATCQGAGGAFFISRTRRTWGTDITVVRMRGLACNHGLGINRDSPSSGTMVDSAFRAARPADERAGLCDFQVGACADFSRAPEWTFTNVVCDDWPYAKRGG